MSQQSSNRWITTIRSEQGSILIKSRQRKPRMLQSQQRPHTRRKHLLRAVNPLEKPDQRDQAHHLIQRQVSVSIWKKSLFPIFVDKTFLFQNIHIQPVLKPLHGVQPNTVPQNHSQHSDGSAHQNRQHSRQHRFHINTSVMEKKKRHMRSVANTLSFAKKDEVLSIRVIVILYSIHTEKYAHQIGQCVQMHPSVDLLAKCSVYQTIKVDFWYARERALSHRINLRCKDNHVHGIHDSTQNRIIANSVKIKYNKYNSIFGDGIEFGDDK